MKIKTLIYNLLLFVFTLFVGVFLTYLHFKHMNYIFVFETRTAKIICFGFIMILMARVIKYIVKPRRTIIKYIVACIAAIFITVGIAALNSLWHYIAFSTQFNFPADISYIDFLIDDITYNISYGVLRYPLFFICFIFVFLMAEKEFLKKFTVCLIRDKIAEFFGVSKVEEVTREESKMLMDMLSNLERVDYNIYRSEYKNMIAYTIEVDKDVKSKNTSD